MTCLNPGDPFQLQPQDVLSSAVVNVLSKTYDIGDWLDWQRTPQGSTNISFFVTASSGRYVLRCSTARKSLDAMRFEVQLIGYLRKRGYPAPTIIPTWRGEGYAEHNGTFYLMTAFIPGSPYDPENMDHLLAAGRGLGLYHQLVKESLVHLIFRSSSVPTPRSQRASGA